MARTLKDSALEALGDYSDTIKELTESIALYDEKLARDDLSDTLRQCYEGLKILCQNQIEECQHEIQRIMSGHYGEYSDEEWAQIQAETNKLLKMRKEENGR